MTEPNVGNSIQINQVSKENVELVNGEKTIKCWNCETVLMVKEEWNVVQCPTCDKVCKIPVNHNIQHKFQFNSHTNNFDVNMPYVYVIIICPYCRTDNKVRNNSEHMVCFKCHNSLNISKDEKSNKSNFNTKISNSNNSNLNTNFPNNRMKVNTGGIPYSTPGSHPMQKSVRFSDLFFPDPMFFPGCYPIDNSYSPLFPAYDQVLLDEQMRRKAQYDLFKYHIEKTKDKTKRELSPIRTRLSDIKQSLNIRDRNDEKDYFQKRNNLFTQNQNFQNAQNSYNDDTGFEDRIKGIKDRLKNNKKSQNQAILRSILEK
jgi:hypothetical protein